MDRPVSVVAAVDLSAISAAVLTLGRGLAPKLGGRCHVLHVVEALSGDEEHALLLPALRRWVDRARAEARQSLDELLGAVGADADPEVGSEVAEGRAATRIVDRARELGARLVVLGGPPPARSLGYTAERVVRRSPVTTLVLRHPRPDGYRRVLVGVDFSAGAERAWDAALALLEPEGRLTACHVIDALGLSRTGEVVSAAGSLEQGLREWAEARADGHPVGVRVDVGAPRHALVEAAEAEQADLLAVGSRGRAGLRQLLLGSVAEAAARRAPCDVLVGGFEPHDPGP